jgi:hypothetical protein
MTTPVTRTPLVIPELGPSLGRLVAPPAPAPGAPAHWIALEDIRLALVTQLFDLAGDARRWAREGDRELALATLNRSAWDTAWGRAVESVAERAGVTVSERLLAAARESRLPAKYARTLPLDAAEVRALAARLDAGSAPLQDALLHLDQLAPAARSERAPAAAVAEWQEALATAARRLEAAWLELEVALHREWRQWEGEVEEVRRWRRPLWPLLLVSALLLALATGVGLLVGGYLPVPPFLAGVMDRIWAVWN